MKKIIAMLMLVCMLTLVCAACSGSNNAAEDTPAVSENVTAEATLPPVTVKTNNDDGQDDLGMIAAEENESVGANVNTDYMATLTEEQRKAEELVGYTVEELFAAIGKPQSTEYTTSCLVNDGQDGILWYDGFTVSTTRYSSGEEVVMGTEKN